MAGMTRRVQSYGGGLRQHSIDTSRPSCAAAYYSISPRLPEWMCCPPISKLLPRTGRGGVEIRPAMCPAAHGWPAIFAIGKVYLAGAWSRPGVGGSAMVEFAGVFAAGSDTVPLKSADIAMPVHVHLLVENGSTLSNA